MRKRSQMIVVAKKDRKSAQLSTIPELSEHFGIKRSTLYYWVRIGRLEPAYPPPEPLLFSLAALKAAVRRAQAKQPFAWYLKLRRMKIENRRYYE